MSNAVEVITISGMPVERPTTTRAISAEEADCIYFDRRRSEVNGAVEQINLYIRDKYRGVQFAITFDPPISRDSHNEVSAIFGEAGWSVGYIYSRSDGGEVLSGVTMCKRPLLATPLPPPMIPAQTIPMRRQSILPRPLRWAFGR